MNPSEFDQFADEYNQAHSRNIELSGEGPEYFHEYKVADVSKALSDAALSPQLRILDFGTGIGNSVPYFRKYFPKADLSAVDVSARSLEVAKQRFADAARFQVIDGVPMPLNDGQFDVVFTACVFHHIPWEEHPAVLRDLHRVLAPGGRLFIFEHNPWNPLTRHAVNTCPFDRNARLITAPRLRRLVADAGFGCVKARFRIFFPRRLAFLRRWESVLTGIPLGAQYVVEARRMS